MQYTCAITINKPIEEVISLFTNPDNMELWMEGLQGFKHLSKEPNKEGAKTELHFKMGKREITMIETIIKNNLPEEMVTTYDAKGVYNKIITTFRPVDGNTTKYISDNYFEFKGFFMKIMGMLMPGAFKKQSMKYLEDFKTFTEKQ